MGIAAEVENPGQERTLSFAWQDWLTVAPLVSPGQSHRMLGVLVGGTGFSRAEAWLKATTYTA